MSKKENAKYAFRNSLINWFYYDRKEDEDLTDKDMENLFNDKQITQTDLIKWLLEWIEENFE